MMLWLLPLVLAVTAENWSVQNEDGVSCIVMDANPVLTLTFTKGNTTVVAKDIAVVNATNVVGNCSAIHDGMAAQTMEVSFFPNGVVPSALEAQEWVLSFVFVKVDEETVFNLKDYSLTTSPQTSVKGSTTHIFKKSGTEDEVKASGTAAFKCSTTVLPLESDSSINLKDLRVIANALKNSTDFDANQTYNVCLLDSRTSDIVPIIVGACLAGLVVVVLVAYLIGRARANRQGYASV